MKKFVVMLLLIAGIAFAGNFQRESDTIAVYNYHQTVHEHYWYNPPYQSNTVHYVRTAPTHCRNINCPRPGRPLPPPHVIHYYNHHPNHQHIHHNPPPFPPKKPRK